MNLTKTEHLLSYPHLRAAIDRELATRKLIEFIRQSWHVIEGRLRVRLRLGWRTAQISAGAGGGGLRSRNNRRIPPPGTVLSCDFCGDYGKTCLCGKGVSRCHARR